MTDHDKGNDSVRAVGRALDVLLAFSSDSKELSAAELAQRVDLSRPTLYRLLYTLESKGFITSVGEPQRFKLGPAVAKVAQAWSQTQDVARVADPIMRTLWEHTRETVGLWMQQGDMRYCIAELPSPQALNLKRGVGSHERIARGASGRAILAFRNIAQPELERLAAYAGVDAAHFNQELQATRERGYARSVDELILGAVAVAAPIFDSTGVIGSIGVFGPTARLGEREVGELGQLVVQKAREVSALLGAPQALPMRPQPLRTAPAA